jgi:hypothetical protein
MSADLDRAVAAPVAGKAEKGAAALGDAVEKVAKKASLVRGSAPLSIGARS